ncbi:MAG: hypothetical protein ACK6B2_11035 [Planctomycetota bacterium]|jgi:hypothetical protein
MHVVIYNKFRIFVTPAIGTLNEMVLVVVLVLEAVLYSNSVHLSANHREPLRSNIGIAVGQTAIEYEYRCTEYRFAEYEYEEIRCDA